MWRGVQVWERKYARVLRGRKSTGVQSVHECAFGECTNNHTSSRWERCWANPSAAGRVTWTSLLCSPHYNEKAVSQERRHWWPVDEVIKMFVMMCQSQSDNGVAVSWTLTIPTAINSYLQACMQRENVQYLRCQRGWYVLRLLKITYATQQRVHRTPRQ